MVKSLELPFLKLIETLTRALFVIVTTYSLPIVEAGQFGLLITLIGYCVFLVGYERYIDIQRKHVNSSMLIFDSMVLDVLKLYSINYIFILPLYILLVFSWLGLSSLLLIACLIILIGEQVSNQAYHLAMIDRRFYKIIYLVIIKNLINFTYLIYLLVGNSPYDLSILLEFWMWTSFISLVFIFLVWSNFKTSSYNNFYNNYRAIIFKQYSWSLTHFLIGLLAITSLQLDRFIVGFFLEFNDVGIYFRHILLAAFLYQIFNIVSFNRVLPVVFGKAKNENSKKLKVYIHNEFNKVIFVTISLLMAVIFLYYGPLDFIFEKYEIMLEILILLSISFIVRVGADFNALIYNAKGREDMLLKIQLTAFGLGSIFFVVLTINLGILGTTIAGVVTSFIYYLLTILNYKYVDSVILSKIKT
jgi:O-antigen/teichoic acid export membrane protein